MRALRSVILHAPVKPLGSTLGQVIEGDKEALSMVLLLQTTRKLEAKSKGGVQEGSE